MLKLALYVQALFLLAEVAGGIVFNSLALLSDAAHMLADVGALALALFAAHIATRPPTARRTYGFARAEVAAALFNAMTLVLAGAWILYEAFSRLRSPEIVGGAGVMLIAAAGLGANLFTAWLLMRADRSNINIRAALAHTLVDAASSIGVLVAGFVVYATGFAAADTVASLLIALLAIHGTWGILRQSLDSLLDAAPDGIDVDRVVAVLRGQPLVTQVHDVHVWSLGARTNAMSAHVLVKPHARVDVVIADLRARLHAQLGIEHATLQVAPDRARERHELVRQLPLEQAVSWASAYVQAVRPSADVAEIGHVVRATAAPATTAGRALVSPVRLALAALRQLDHAHGAGGPPREPVRAHAH